MNLIGIGNWRGSTAAFAVAAALGFAAAPALADDMPGKGKSVQPVATEDSAAQFQIDVVIVGLKKLGYDVKDTKYVDIPAAYIALGQGDGDFYAQSWDPLQNAFYERAGGEAKLMRLGALIDGASQGYLVDKASYDKGVKNLGQLKDAAIAKQFDGDGDGKADLIGCPPGWGCERVIEFQLDAYGLRDTVEHIQGDFTATHVDAVTRYKAGQSVLYYTYTPLWLGQLLVPGRDVEWLEVPETALPPEQITPDTKMADGRNVGWPLNKIRVTANNDFLAANPAAKKLFELLAVPLADVNAQNLLVYNGEKSNEEIRKHAEKWAADNAQQFDAWVAEAAKAK